MNQEGEVSERVPAGAEPAERTGVASRSEWLFPLLLAVGLTVFKLAFIIPSALGPYFSDEIMYREFAEELLRFGHYVRVQYPLLYPLAMVPGAASQGQWPVMLALGSFYSSLLVLPAYGLARQVMGRYGAVLATLLIAALPFHTSYPRMVMSENVFYPLLVLAVWLVVRARRSLLFSDIVLGVVIAALWLTRHVAIVLVPALFIAWWLRERFPHPADGAYGRSSLAGSLLRFGALAVACGVTYAPWLVMTMGGGASLSLALGFGVSGEWAGNAAERDTARLIALAGWYIAAFALIAAPVLPGFTLAFRSAWREGLRSPFARLLTTLVLIAGALLVAMTRHSFNVNYNYPEPTKLMSRYA